MCIWAVLVWLVGIFKPWWWMVVEPLTHTISLLCVFSQKCTSTVLIQASVHCPEHHLGAKTQIQALIIPCLLHRSCPMQIKGDWLGSLMYFLCSGQARSLVLQRPHYRQRTFSVSKSKQRESGWPMKSCMPLPWSCTHSCWSERSPPRTTNQSACPTILLVFVWATMAMSLRMIHH